MQTNGEPVSSTFEEALPERGLVVGLARLGLDGRLHAGFGHQRRRSQDAAHGVVVVPPARHRVRLLSAPHGALTAARQLDRVGLDGLFGLDGLLGLDFMRVSVTCVIAVLVYLLLIRIDGKPYANHMQTICKSYANHMQTKCKPNTNHDQIQTNLISC